MRQAGVGARHGVPLTEFPPGYMRSVNEAPHETFTQIRKVAKKSRGLCFVFLRAFASWREVFWYFLTSKAVGYTLRKIA